MISKNQLKTLAAYRLMKNCDAAGVFVVEGVKMAEEALGSGFHIQAICASAQWLEQHPTPNAEAVFEADSASLERLSQMRTPNEVWMLVERKSIENNDNTNGLTLVCDRIQDPGNMGTIMRTADWFGIRHIVCSEDTASCYNPKVVQSSMGAIFRTNVDYTNLQQWLQTCGRPIYGAVLGGENLYSTPLTRPAALVIGNESQGISAPLQQLLTQRVTIPNMGGTAESLNAAVATGILVAEFFRK